MNNAANNVNNTPFLTGGTMRLDESLNVGDAVFMVSGQRPEVLTGTVAEVYRGNSMPGVRVGDDWWAWGRVYRDRATADAEHASERAEWLAFCQRVEAAERKLLASHGFTA